MDRPDRTAASGSLLTIGAFARAVDLTATALRHYDECGLLEPALVDDTTGYRYYTPDLARRAHLIRRMREVGVPIETMRRVLDGSDDDARAALAEHAADSRDQARRSWEVATEVLSSRTASREQHRVSAEAPGVVLAAALRQALEAADRDPGSPLAAVLLDVEDDALDVVATDRHWLVRRRPSVDVVGGAARVVVPSGAARDLAVLLDTPGSVRLLLDAGRLDVQVRQRTTQRTTRVTTLDTAYPAHRLVLAGLPVAVAHVVMERASLLDALEIAGTSVVDLELPPGGDLRVVRRSAATVPATVSDSHGLGSVGVSRSLLQRAVTTCVGDRVTLALSSPDAALVLGSPHQPDLTVALMPIAPS